MRTSNRCHAGVADAEVGHSGTEADAGLLISTAAGASWARQAAKCCMQNGALTGYLSGVSEPLCNAANIIVCRLYTANEAFTVFP